MIFSVILTNSQLGVSCNDLLPLHELDTLSVEAQLAVTFETERAPGDILGCLVRPHSSH